MILRKPRGSCEKTLRLRAKIESASLSGDVPSRRRQTGLVGPVLVQNKPQSPIEIFVHVRELLVVVYMVRKGEGPRLGADLLMFKLTDGWDGMCG